MRGTFSIISLLLFLNLSLSAINIQRGERPRIDLDKISDEAFYDTHIRIKVLEDFSDLLPTSIKNDSQKIITEFGIAELDELNTHHSVKEIVSLYYTTSYNEQFGELHRSWGFHLWYELRFSEPVDIRKTISSYRNLSIIEKAEPEYKKTFHNLSTDKNLTDDPLRWNPNDPQFPQQWNLNNTGQHGGTFGSDIRMPNAWDLEKGSSDVKVGIIDQGILYTHPDISGNMWSNLGFNFYSNNQIISPGDHGTHVAGIVSGVSHNSEGITGIAGGSGQDDGVRLISCQIAIGSNFNNIHLGMLFAADIGAAIMQNGWGYSVPGVYDELVLDAIDYFNQNGGGNVLIGGLTVFSAGNNNSSADYYPAYYSGAFSVAATTNQDIKAFYSNYGNWVDISAPGGEINVNPARGIRSTITNDDYAFYQGTSQAAPHVSGAAALVVSHTSRYGIILTNTALANILRDSAYFHYFVNPSYYGLLGSGRLNANSALLHSLTYLGDVLNPLSFTATMVSTNQIDLEWTPNADNDEVMVVWSPNGQFGTPFNGMLYTVGQTLVGGGTVLYRGSNTSFNHLNLNEGTPYYYKAFSYDQDNQYSFGRTAFTYTDYQGFLLPFSENFNSSTNLPPFWEIVDNVGYGQTWEIGTILYGGLSGTTGNYAYLNSYSFGAGNSQDSDLISPKLNLSSYSQPILTFTHYYIHLWNTSTATVSYSIDNGVSWTPIQSWTATIPNPSYFYQTLPQVAGHSEVRFKWSYTASYDRLWCIDDVLITDNSLFGTVDGQVTLHDGMGDITQTVISTQNGVTNPDINGNYTLPLLPGTYNITASLANYESQTITGVLVNQESVTSEVNFDLYLVSPPPPQNLTAIPGYQFIMLQWDSPQFSNIPNGNNPSEGRRRTGSPARNNYTLLGYDIYRNDQLLNPELITDAEFTDNDVTIGETYSYYGVAIYDIGSSEPSNIVTITAPDRVATPMFSPGGGLYENPIQVVIETTTPAALIYYTLNDDSPDTFSLPYYNPIYVAESLILKARAYRANWLPSEIASAVYEIASSSEEILQPELKTSLVGAFPNPFNPETQIIFSLAKAERVTIRIYNAAGKLVRKLSSSEPYPAGEHSLLWNGENSHGQQTGSGIYLYKMQTDTGYTEVRKMALIK